MTAVPVCRTTTLWKSHNVVFSYDFLFCVQYSDGLIRFRRLREDHASLACIWYRHRGPASDMMVFAAIGYTKHTSELTVFWTHIGTFLTSYVRWLYPILDACQKKSFNKIIHDHILCVVFWPFLIHGIFHCYPHLHGLQIWQQLKTSSHGFLRDSPPPYSN